MAAPVGRVFAGQAFAQDQVGQRVRAGAKTAFDAVLHVGKAAEQGYAFAYAQDEAQEVARAYGAERTPEVYVLDGERRIRYHGAIDDDRDEASVREHWLRDALDAVLGGDAPATAETPAVGCTIKWRR